MRLIDADKLVEELKERANVEWVEWNKKKSPISWRQVLEIFIDEVDEQPTIEPEDFIRHEKWVRLRPSPFDLFKCSGCGAIYDNEFKNCPECRAMMDLPLLLEETDWDE